LRYFVNKKITKDAKWRGVRVVLFGHKVSGEGEHKIMECIRLSRAQPDYNSNVWHCLYGLDADLIMLKVHACMLVFYGCLFLHMSVGLKHLESGTLVVKEKNLNKLWNEHFLPR
ncbi:XRN 5'-3' exonuclease N-terminus-domain-containing protein, partial [Suillus tomentosus]